tara:strand:- start:11817 stop:13199 length:1383 start_codon:yes stop_codon:yes gene_type:complete
MEYISTRNTKKTFSFEEVFLKGLAPDGGLFVPTKIYKYSAEELEKLRSFSYNGLAASIISKFCGSEFKQNELESLINSSYKQFRAKNVVEIKKLQKTNLLELYYGPTLAFKDIAMQVIGNMYEKILKKNNLRINIIVATSGDTGAAAISAIQNRKNMKIFVLHPHNKISEIQRKFMTTVTADNVFNIALDGNFDDCQNFVKSMFTDEDFNKKINLSGVNSINWSRIAIQIVYYFYSYFVTSKNNTERINFSVPTGNFGDIYAGYVAKKMGLPINKLLIATNKNDILKRVINTGIYKPLKTEHTISPSMDIQVASNFERLVFDCCLCDSERVVKLMNDLKENGEFKLNEKELNKIKETFCSESLTEKETLFTISETYKEEKILIDPHTAVGIGALKKSSVDGNTVILSTAHPCKFSDVVFKTTGIKPELPETLKKIKIEKEKFDKLPKNIKLVKDYILKKV